MFRTAHTIEKYFNLLAHRAFLKIISRNTINKIKTR